MFELSLDESIADDVRDIRSTVTVGFVGFTILVFDHVITFADEVEVVWRKPKGPLGYLFLLNRYLTPLAFIVNLWAYLWPDWTPERCAAFVQYEGSMTVVGINIVALIMLLRIRAIYNKNPYVVGVVGTIFIIELAVNIWLVCNGHPVGHTGPIQTCTMIFSESVGSVASASAWLPLLYDTVVLGLTVFRTIQTRTSTKTTALSSQILKIVLNEGLLYYSVICTITLILTIMIKTAPPNLQNICAQLELLLTVAMMSRITLDLRKKSYKVVYRINTQGKPVPDRDIETAPSNISTVIFEHQPADPQTNPDPDTKTDWGREVEPRRPCPARWVSEVGGRRSVERLVVLGSSVSLPQMHRVHAKSLSGEGEREWIELKDKPMRVPGPSSDC